MSDNKFDRKIPKRRKGTLDSHNIWRAQTKVENIFRQKQERKNKDYHVVLLVDQSASMRGNQKDAHAAELALFMSQELERVDINFSIIGFSDEIHVIKKANESVKKLGITELQKKLLRKPGGGGTDIHMGLEEAFDVLRHEKHGKIVIVLSDGGGNRGVTRHGVELFKKKFGRDPFNEEDVLANMPEIFNRDEPDRLRGFIQSHPETHTVGVGVLDNAVQHSFPNHILVKNLSEFKPKVLQALKKSIKRG